VTVFLNALAKPDPVAALVDAWAFSLQLVDFLEQDGAGAHLFGEYQHVMVDAARSVAAEVDDLVEEVTRDDAVEGRELVAQWVSANPLSSRQMIRSSTTILLADELEAAEDSPFAALGRLQLGIDDITATLQRYTSIFPRTIRWHSQLILHETLYDEFDLGSTREMVDSMLADLADLGELADELLATLPSGEELDAELAAAMARLQGAIDEERARLLAEVDRQRGLVFDDVTAQREAIMSDVEAQILLAQERIQAQVDEVFARIESLTEETITRSFAESERLVRLVYSRVLILLLVAIAGGAGLILLNKWRRPIET
jgi:hypothetical protein